jgi:Short C-terminal domain
MPGLLRGVARTAVIAGTASAVSGRVQRRQAERFAERDAQIYAQRGEAYEVGAQAARAAPAPEGGSDTISQLKELAELHSQGVLTDDEFAAQKAKLLNS